MPSPFPGMDPYLEHPEYFPGLHDRMIAAATAALKQGLPKSYYCDSQQRVWIEFSQRSIVPDVFAARKKAKPSNGATPSNGAGVALATAPAVTVESRMVVVPSEMYEPYLEIRTLHGDRQVVTVIEFLSPSNKALGNQARDSYRKKQLECLSCGVNLVEIDLLRGGTHTTAVSVQRAIAAASGVFDYHVCVRNAAAPESFLVYPLHLPERLPTIAVPLLPQDVHVALDLQAVFDRAHDEGPEYADLGAYERHPDPPLPEDLRPWAAERLKAAGISA